MGKALGSKSIIAAPFTGGTSLLGNGKVKDFLFGAKTPGTPDEVIDLGSAQGRALQEKMLGKYGEVLDSGVGSQMAAQERQVRAGAEDQTRQAQQMVAQRGLQNSSIGLNAILNSNRDTGDRIGAIRASEPMLKQQNLQFANQGINSILNEQGQSKIFKQGQAAQGRSGGLVAAAAPIAGSVLGGMAGSGAFNGMAKGGFKPGMGMDKAGGTTSMSYDYLNM